MKLRMSATGIKILITGVPTPEEVRASRLATGVSQQAAADALGVTRVAWQSWEYGRARMPQASWALWLIMVTVREPERRPACIPATSHTHFFCKREQNDLKSIAIHATTCIINTSAATKQPTDPADSGIKENTMTNITTNEFGQVIFGGVEYTLTQQAFADNLGTEGEVVYRASAVDADGNGFVVIWDTTPEWDASVGMAAAEMRGNEPDMEAISEEFGVPEDFVAYDMGDESNACDWEKPAAVNRA